MPSEDRAGACEEITMIGQWKQLWWEPFNIINTDYDVLYDARVMWECQLCGKKEVLIYWRQRE